MSLPCTSKVKYLCSRIITELAVDECHNLKRAMCSDDMVFIYLKRAGGLELYGPFVLRIFSADVFAGDSFTNGEVIF